ncbi:MAG: aspartate 1-decarboxylase [Magnetococcales bacterium]|nr:aspartate 1-decarboxylase [Magnetococcales bacterium]
MELSLLKCKLHGVTVTDVHLDYDGSCAIDEDLLEAAGLREFEQIHLWNVTSGERLITYAIRAQRGSGVISVNGAAAHKARVGEKMIIAAFAQMSDAEAAQFVPRLVYLDGANRIREMSGSIAVQAA